MKKVYMLLMIMMLSVLVCGVAHAEEITEQVAVLRYNNIDGLSMGFIDQSVFEVSEDEAVRIDMQEVYAMYPEHSGVYGVVYASDNIRITADEKGGSKSVSGNGVIRFSFPGAESCTITGQGTVYGYFIPVPYRSLSNSTSLVREKYDPAYVTKTLVGHYNTFMLLDAHMYIHSYDYDNYNVEKHSSVLGPLPAEYQFMEYPLTGNGTIGFYGPYLSERPVLVQCSAMDENTYGTDVFTARPMQKLVDKEGYEIWSFREYASQSGSLLDHIDDVMDASMTLAEREFLPGSRTYDPIIVALLREEMQDANMELLSLSDETESRMGFRNFLMMDTQYLEDTSQINGIYMLANHVGAMVQKRSLAYVLTSFANWFNSGFATYFGEKVMREMGYSGDAHAPISQIEAAELEKFRTDMVFGVKQFSEYMDADQAGVLMTPKHGYDFGCCFMYYLEEKYGEGFFKRISDSFYQNWYQGHEGRFFMRRNELDYNVDLFYSLIKAGLDDNVYVDFPAYAVENYEVCLLIESPYHLKNGIRRIEAEAFSGVPVTSIQIPDTVEFIGAGAFANCPNLEQIVIPPSVVIIEESENDPEELIVFGVPGSCAQTFAEKKGYVFLEIYW